MKLSYRITFWGFFLLLTLSNRNSHRKNLEEISKSSCQWVSIIKQGIICLDKKVLQTHHLQMGNSITKWPLNGAESATLSEPLTAMTMQLGVEINHASFEQIVTLPLVGSGLAKKILQARPFYRVEDLRKVSGIGPVRFGQLSAWLYLEKDSPEHSTYLSN